MEFSYSIIISSYKRASSLERLLISLKRTYLPENGEIVVIYRESGDQTSQIINKFRETFPVPLRSCIENTPGASAARNRAASLSDKEYLIFMDDDETASKNLINEYKKGAEKFNFDLACGRIINIWTKKCNKEKWFPEKFPVSNGEVDFGGKIFTLPAPHIHGGNFIIKRKLFKNNLFDTGFGKGDKIDSGEDSALALKLRSVGISSMYFPDAKVFHINERERNKREYWYKSAAREGKAQAYIEKQHSSGVCLKIISRILALKVFSILYFLLSFSASKRFYYKCKVIKQLAMIRQFFRKS